MALLECYQEMKVVRDDIMKKICRPDSNFGRGHKGNHI